MPFEVVLRTDLSLGDLVELHQQGAVVTKTPHVGNWYPCNLAIGSLGIPMLAIDRTIGFKDANFHPHCVIVHGQKHQIADQTLLSTHNRVIGNGLPVSVREFFPPAAKVSQGHVAALRRAIPQLQVTPFTDWQIRNSERLNALLEAMTEHFPSLWERYVDRDGQITHDRVRSVRCLRDHGIYGVTNLESGWVTPNVANIVTHESLAVADRGKSESYHISGPDMYRYIGDHKEQMHALYDRFRDRLPSLPPILCMNLVPAADFRFAVLAHKRPQLDAMVGLYQEVVEADQSWRRKLAAAASREQRSALIRQKEGEVGDLKKRLSRATGEVGEFFYDIYQGDFVSQYDMLATGQALYVHPWATQAKVSELSVAVKLLFQSRKHSSTTVVVSGSSSL